MLCGVRLGYTICITSIHIMCIYIYIYISFMNTLRLLFYSPISSCQNSSLSFFVLQESAQGKLLLRRTRSACGSPLHNNYIYICVYTYTSVYIYIYIYIHTYMHIHCILSYYMKSGCLLHMRRALADRRQIVLVFRI